MEYDSIAMTEIQQDVENLNIIEIPPILHSKLFRALKVVAWHFMFAVFFAIATYKFITGKNACVEDCEFNFCSPYIILLLLTSCFYLDLIYDQILKRFLDKLLKQKFFIRCNDFLRKLFQFTWPKFVIVASILVAVFGYIGYQSVEDSSQLQPLLGIFSFIIIGLLFSENVRKIKLQPVLCGAFLQFLLAIFCIRWTIGRKIFECFGSKIAVFLNYTLDGASFVYGNFLVLDKKVFVFSVLPTIFFFNLCISVLHYLGVMQKVLMKLGSVLQSVLGTTICESVAAVGMIFLSITEGPLVIKPYIKSLTDSEMHAVMVSAYSTVSGTVLAAYISFGAEARHLITASVIAAPASLFFSKLMFPETEESKTSSKNIQLEKSSDPSMLDAATNGAQQGIEVILSIVAILVAFLAVISLTDGLFLWLTTLLGFENIGIQFVLGKIFVPVSWAIGIEWKDCEAIGNVIGTKMIFNEFVAFHKLGEYNDAGEISPRSFAIATYAVCGFANPSSMGIMIGTLSVLAPERKKSITKVAFRAFIAGSIVPLLTASIAGFLMTNEMIASGGLN